MKKIICLFMVAILSLLCFFGCESKEEKPVESSEVSYEIENEPSDYFTAVETMDAVNEAGDITLKITSAEFRNLGFKENDFVRFSIRGQNIMVAVVSDIANAEQNLDVLILGDGDVHPILSVVGGDFAAKYGIISQLSGEKEIMNDVSFPLEVGFSMADEGGYRK